MTWTITDSTGALVRSRYDALALADPKTYYWAWDGRDTSGSFVPRGRYYVNVTATDGASTISQRAWVQADGFRLSASDTTPGRGQSVTITAITAETLGSLPRLRVYQPGHTGYSVTMTKVSSTTYRVTIHLSSSGPTGTLDVRAVGYDLSKGMNSARLLLPLH